MNTLQRLLVAALTFCLLLIPAQAQRQMEKLGRGLIAQRTSATQVYVGWRLLGNDPEDVAFNLYRSANGAAAIKLNVSPITASTNYLDTPANLATTSYTYSVRPVVNNVETPDTWAHPLSSAATVAANATALTWPYLRIPLQPTPDGTHDVKFCWVGDLDGDGEYDFVVDRQPPAEARQFLEAYKRDGTFLWRLDLGPNSANHYNIEPGSSTVSIGHGDNATVCDMDGDGKAEVLLRTANGVVFANGTTLTHADNRVQFISVINGETGVERARAQIPNPFLSDGQMQGHMGVLYCDGVLPSLFYHYTNRRNTNGGDLGFNGMATTWDFRNGVITQRWSKNFNTLTHEAAGHQIRIGDPDNDGKDEYLDVGHGLDDNGAELYANPEIVHGDRFHVGDMDPDRPGLETFVIQQNNASGLATALYESATGNPIRKWYAGGVVDVGRGNAADIDPAHKGYELVSTRPGIFNAKGEQIYASGYFPTENIWWDADLGRELLMPSETVRIQKVTNGILGYFDLIDKNTPAPGAHLAYAGRPAFWGDIVGDWREEIVCVENGNTALRIYTTPRVASNRIYTLMQNPQYRAQTTTKGYVQSSLVDYYLGAGMTVPPPPPMVDAKLVWRGGTGTSTWDLGATSSWKENGVNRTYADGDTVRFDISGNNTTAVTLVGTLSPGALTVYNPKPYTFAGAGVLAGAMKLTKAGAGVFTLPGTHPFTGRTTVWDGALIVNGDLAQSPVIVWGGVWGGPLAKGATGGRIGGAGRFGQAVTVKYRGTVSPGNGVGHAATLTFGNGLAAEDGATFALDLSDDPTGLAKTNDRLAITGNLALSGKVTLVLNALDPALGAGTYTLATYTGTLTGGLANLAVIVPPGTPHTVAVGAGAITLNVPVTRAPASVVWRGSGSAWDIATSQNWLLAGAPAVFVAGDTVTLDATGSASPAITLQSRAPVAGITVAASTHYTIGGAGSLGGTGGLLKSGAGTLTLNTTNDYTGPTTINGGVLAVANLDNGGLPSSLGASSSAASNLVLNGGTLRIPAAQTSTNRNVTLGTSGGTLDVAVSSSSLQISGAIGGTGTLTKSGPGTLILAKANTYTGGTVINGGTIYLAGATPNVSGLGSGVVTINNGTLAMSDVQASETAAWNLVVPSGATGRLDTDGRCFLTGSLTGGGTFTVHTGFVRTDLRGNWSAFTGTIHSVTDADGGDFRISNTFGYGNATLNLGAGVYAYYNASGSVTIPLGALSGSATSTLLGGSSAGGLTTYQIGAKNISSTYSGVIANRTGPSAVAKVGTGTLTLAGANTYTGATTVSAGTLQVAGSLTGSAVTVQSGAGLGGGGAITGNVTFAGGGRLVANLSGPPLAITGNLAVNGAVTVSGVVPAAGTYPILTYSGALTGSPAFVWSGAGHAATFNTSVAGVVSATFVVDNGTPPSPPAAPDGLVATAATPTQINLSWTDHSTDETGFLVERSPDGVTFTQIASVAAGVTSYSNPGLVAATLYHYRVRATNLVGPSGYSNIATATTPPPPPPQTPEGLTATAVSSSQITLSWSDQSDDETGFFIERSLDNVTFAQIASVGADIATFADQGLAATTSYHYRVRATNPVGPSAYSNVASATTLETSVLSDVVKANNTTNLNVGSSWVGGTAPLADNIAVWNSTVSAANTTLLGADASWAGLRVANPAGAVTIGAGNTLTLGAAGIDLGAATQNLALNNAVSLGATQTWNVASGRFVTVGGAITAAGGIGLIKTGPGQLTLAPTLSAAAAPEGITVNQGTLRVNGGGSSFPVRLNGGTLDIGAALSTPVEVNSNGGRISVLSNRTLSADISGIGTALLTLSSQLSLTGSIADFGGGFAYQASTSGIRLNGAAFAGSPDVSFDLGTSTGYLNRNNSAAVVSLGSLAGGPSTALTVGAGAVTWSIGGKNLASTFSGTISGAATLVKTGAETLTLGGTNTYTGATTVADGTLALSGSLTNTASVEVLAGATLHLTGALTTGTLTIRAGGQLTGGGVINAIVVNEGLVEATGVDARFAFTGALTNAATGVMRFSGGAGFTRSGGAAFTNDGVLDIMTAGAFAGPTGGAGGLITAESVTVSAFDLVEGDTPTLTVSTHAGHVYQLQRSIDLAAGVWENIGASQSGTGAAQLFVDLDPPAGPRYFYRILVSP